MSPLTRFAIWAAVLAVLGIVLEMWFGTIRDVWPFGLTRLGAGAHGQWFLTVAVAMAWSARENDWWRIRLLAPFYPLFFALVLIQAARTAGDFAGGVRTWVYLGAFAISAVVFAILMLTEENRFRSRQVRAAASARDAISS